MCGDCGLQAALGGGNYHQRKAVRKGCLVTLSNRARAGFRLLVSNEMRRNPVPFGSERAYLQLARVRFPIGLVVSASTR